MQNRAPKKSSSSLQNTWRAQDKDPRKNGTGPKLRQTPDGGGQKSRERISKHLDAPLASIRERIEQNPGTTIEELIALEKIPETTCRYRVKRLVRLGVIRPVCFGRKRYFYLAGASLTLEDRLAPILKNAHRAKVLRALTASDGSSVSSHALARQTGLDPGVVYRVLDFLEEMGVIRKSKSHGRYKVELLVELGPMDLLENRRYSQSAATITISPTVGAGVSCETSGAGP